MDGHRFFDLMRLGRPVPKVDARQTFSTDNQNFRMLGTSDGISISVYILVPKVDARQTFSTDNQNFRMLGTSDGISISVYILLLTGTNNIILNVLNRN